MLPEPERNTVMTSTAPDTLPGLEVLPAPDQVAIGTTLTKLLRGFATRDADLLVGIYADDADWVNAFGSVKKGAAEIVGYLRGLFADPNFDAGKLVAPPQSHLRKVTDDVVTVSSTLQIAGQLLLSGEPIAVRDNHSLRVLARQRDGHWLVVSEMYSDSRSDQSYVNHS